MALRTSNLELTPGNTYAIRRWATGATPIAFSTDLTLPANTAVEFGEPLEFTFTGLGLTNTTGISNTSWVDIENITVLKSV